VLTEVPFVGRAEQIQAFHEFCMELREVPNGDPAGRLYCNVHGELGIGKSALAAELEEEVRGADAVSAVLVPLDELDVLDVFTTLAHLRRALGHVAPEIECPRFETAYSLYLASYHPRDFGPNGWVLGPVDPTEVFRKAVEGGAKQGIQDILGHLSRGAIAAGTGGAAAATAAGAVGGSASAAAAAAAMTSAFIGAGAGVGAYLMVLLAQHYVVGLRAKARHDDILRSSQRLQALLDKGEKARVADFRRDLPLLLAEDLNAAFARTPRALVLMIDPVDALDDERDFRAEPFAEGLMRLVAALERGYVLTFCRARPEHWEKWCEVVADRGPLNAVFQTRYQELGGLSEAEVAETLVENSVALKLDEAEVAATVAAFPRLSDGRSISPTVFAAYWNLRTEE